MGHVIYVLLYVDREDGPKHHAPKVRDEPLLDRSQVSTAIGVALDEGLFVELQALKSPGVKADTGLFTLTAAEQFQFILGFELFGFSLGIRLTLSAVEGFADQLSVQILTQRDLVFKWTLCRCL